MKILIEALYLEELNNYTATCHDSGGCSDYDCPDAGCADY